VTRRGAILFALLGVAWGIPYLLIKVAVAQLDPAMLVLARTVIAAVVLLPFALYLNWPLGSIMVAVAAVFGGLTTLVINKTETLQRTVERHYSDLAERASDTLGNVALVQGFARVEAEVTGLRTIADDLLAAQIPVLSWWAVVAVLTRASTTLTMLGIFVAGVTLHFQGRATIGDIVKLTGTSRNTLKQHFRQLVA